MQKSAAGDVMRRRSRRGGGEWSDQWLGRSGRCRKRESRRREMHWRRKKNREGEGEEREKKPSDVHTSPIVAADALRPDGSTLATVGDATLRAHIINRAHIIFVIINYIIIALHVGEQAGISVFSLWIVAMHAARSSQSKKCDVSSVTPRVLGVRSRLCSSPVHSLRVFFCFCRTFIIQIYYSEVACTESPNPKPIQRAGLCSDCVTHTRTRICT